MSVLLKGRNGNELELAFVRETLPDVQDGMGDSDWFTLVRRTAKGDETWEESSPCLSAYQFQTLAEWLEAAGGAEGAEGSVSELELLEPELKFTLVQQDGPNLSIRVGFHLTDRPEEFEVDDPSEDTDYVDLYMDKESLRTAAATLRTELVEFLGQAKDETQGENEPSGDGKPDPDLNIVDRVEKYPPGAGRGEDNAGNR